jgi:ABC-type transport system involved in multi-copper enzyme maturation permease subunit
MTRITTIAHIVWLQMLRKKDIYVFLILITALLIALVSLNIFGLGGVTGYLKEAGFLLAWLFGLIIAVNICSRELPQEENRGTIFPMLAKPISRFEFIAGKWLGAFTVVSTALLMFYLMITVVVILKGGSMNFFVLVQGYILHCCALGIISAIAIAFSTRMHSDAAAAISYVLTFTAFIVVPRIPSFLVKQHGFSGTILLFLYNLMPHFEIFDMRKRIIHNYGTVSGNIILLAVIYAAAFTLIFLLIAWLAYRKKRFSRGTLF